MNVETVVDDPERLARTFVRRVEILAAEGVAARGRFSLLLTGGSVAETFLPALADATVYWPSVDVFWGDERAVPPEHADSNYGLVRRLLLDRVPLDPGRVHRMRGEAADFVAAAAEYEAELKNVLGDPPALDVALLGVGPDGHVCSLFEGHPALRESTRLVVPIGDSPKPPPRRITLTLSALRHARLLVVAAWGAGKAEVVRQVRYAPASTLPAALAMRAATRALLLVDAPAASTLRQTE